MINTVCTCPFSFGLGNPFSLASFFFSAHSLIRLQTKHQTSVPVSHGYYCNFLAIYLQVIWSLCINQATPWLIGRCGLCDNNLWKPIQIEWNKNKTLWYISALMASLCYHVNWCIEKKISPTCISHSQWILLYKTATKQCENMMQLKLIPGIIIISFMMDKFLLACVWTKTWRW